jgi:hypothetical protein
VSATDRRKYEDVPALQDNAEAVLSGLAAASPLARWLLYGDWVHTKEFLAAALLVAFSVAYDQVHRFGFFFLPGVVCKCFNLSRTPHQNNSLSPTLRQVPYSGFGLMARWCASIACGRLLRVACFLTTVLPSPRPGCYSRRFPPPPDTLKETLRVGFTTLRGTGGCNDLIFRFVCVHARVPLCARLLSFNSRLLQHPSPHTAQHLLHTAATARSGRSRRCCCRPTTPAAPTRRRSCGWRWCSRRCAIS